MSMSDDWETLRTRIASDARHVRRVAVVAVLFVLIGVLASGFGAYFLAEAMS